MKKLLAAVTSFAMSVSLMSSAFASPFNVSAAGSISAEQPNVSMGEVLDGAVNKTAVQADFVVTPNDIKAKPGDTVEVEVYASAGSHKVGQYIVRLDQSDLPQGITYSVDDPLCYAVGAAGNYKYELLGDTYYCSTLSSGDPTPVNEDEPVIIFNFTIPKDAAPGEYSWNLSRFHVVEDGINHVEYDANVKPGKITIEGDVNNTTNTTKATTTSSEKNTTTTKAPDPNAKADFIVTPKTVTAKPGDNVEVECYVDAGSHKVGQYIVRLDNADLPQGITYTVDDPLCYAVGASGNFEYKLLGDTYYCSTLSSGDPTPVNEDEPVIIFNFQIPKTATPGTYNWNLSRFHVVEDGINHIEFDATVKPGTIVIEGDSKDTTTASTASTQGTTTTASIPKNVASDFVITPQDVNVKPGDTVEVEVGVQAGGHKVGQYVVRLDDADLPQGITASLEDNVCYAVKDSGTYTFEKIQDTYYCGTLKSGDPLEVDESQPVMIFQFKVPTTAKPGSYDWTFSRFHVVEDGYNKIEFDANVKSAKINIIGDVATTTTTTQPKVETTTTTTSQPKVDTTTTTISTAQDTTTATTTANNGKAVWAIPNVKAKAGSTVKMDIIVDGQSDLAVAGAQFDINAASPIKLSAADKTCAAYSSALTANVDTAEFAFGEDKGAANIAADGAVIASLTFTVPAGASGVYPVKWDDVMVTDTNGKDITSQVTLKDGSITVEAGVNGAVTWEIPTVHAKAGSTAKMEIAAKVGTASLEVAGAQFTVSSDKFALASVGKNSAAYSANVTSNTATNEIAFANAKGGQVAAEDGAIVAVVNFDIPAGTPAGKYPVIWGKNAFVSDTNGNDITSLVELVDGMIIVDDVTDGDITWTIEKKHAKPGDTVELEATVTVGEKNLAVGGAQFDLPVSDPIALAGAAGSDAYSAPVSFNKDTNEFAFANKIGEGVEAKDGSTVIKLTYKVSETAKPGEYPISWTEAFVSDTNGADITAKISFVDGAIIIDDETTTSTSTTSTDVTTTTSTSAPVNTTTTSTSTGEGTTTTTTTTVTAPDGAILWQISEVTAVPGETVEVPVLVLDPNKVNLPIGGAQFKVTADTVVYTSVSGSDAYGAKVVANPATFEFAFADEKGNEMAAANGAKVMTLSYTVPKGTPEGKYPVVWDNDFFSVSSADGVDMTNHIVCVNGAIHVIVPKVDSTSTTTTTTTTDVDTTTTTSTTKTDEESTSTSTSTTKTDEGSTSTSTSTTKTDEGSTSTSTSTTQTTTSTSETTTTTTSIPVPQGAVVWQLNQAKGKPGETVTLTMTVLDPHGSALVVGGGQFALDADPAIAGAAGTPYGAKLNYNPATREFAFADEKGAGVASKNGAVMMTIEYTIPADAKAGDKYEVSFKDLFVTDGDGNDITSYVLSGDGLIEVIGEETTTTTTTTTTTDVDTTTTTSTTKTGEGLTSTSTSTTKTDEGSTSTSTSTTKTGEGSTSTSTSTTKTGEGSTSTSTSTTQTTTSTTQTTTTTTTIPVPKGAVAWQLNQAKGKPGEKVTLTMTVLDPHGSALVVGGGQFVLDAVPAIAGASGTPYGAKLNCNPATREFAFAYDKGDGAPSANGAIMMTIEYIIPADAKAGDKFEVNFKDLLVTDSDGNDITANVLPIGGLIEVIGEVTTTSTTTTTSDVHSTTTTTSTTVPGSDTTTSTSTTKTGEGSTTTSTSTTKTDEGSTTTSTSTTKTDEGSTTTSTSTTKTDEGSTTTSTSTTKTDEGSTTTSTSTTKTGDPDTSTTSTSTSTGDPNSDTTTTTTTTDVPVSTTSVYAQGKAVNGYYFSHDPRSFKKGHVENIKLYSVNEDGEITAIDNEEFLSKVTFKAVTNGASTPEETYDVANTTFAYEIAVYFDGAPLKDGTGKPVTFTAYIGVKGDSDLNNKVDSSDATNVLSYYATLATTDLSKVSPDDIRITPAANKFVNANPELDQLCAFLADVDRDVYDADNWRTRKGDVDANGKLIRKLDSSDASWILGFYSTKSTSPTSVKDHSIWNEVLADQHRGERFEEYKNAE